LSRVVALAGWELYLNNLSKYCLPIFICSDSEQHTDQSPMTDQALSDNGQHQRWVASGEQQVASGGSGWQQGGSRVETLPDHGRCWFVVLKGYQPLTDGICDDVLDVVEGIAGKTVIELTQELEGIIERYGSDKNMYT
jgi:hypothetical protein